MSLPQREQPSENNRRRRLVSTVGGSIGAAPPVGPMRTCCEGEKLWPAGERRVVEVAPRGSAFLTKTDFTRRTSPTCVTASHHWGRGALRRDPARMLTKQLDNEIERI
jgi:hypothetical protein